MLRRALLLTLVVAGSPLTAVAEGPFIGASVGNANLDDALGNIGPPDDRVDINLDDDSPGWSAFAGYELGRYVGIRAGYIDFSTFDDVLDFGIPGTPTIDVDLDGWTLGVDGYLPIGNWFRLTGHVGVIQWDAKVQIDFAGIDRSEDGSDVFYGAGIEFDLAGFLTLGSSYTRYEIADSDVDYAAAHVRYRF